MNLFNQLFLNMLIIITPVMLYQLFWGDRHSLNHSTTNKRVIAILSTIIAILCMTYPFRFSSGFFYDFRLIPLAVCMLYAGFLPSLWVMLAILAHRLILGGNPVALVVSTALLMTLILLVKCFKPYIMDQTKTKNVTSGFILGLCLGIISTLYSCIAFWFTEQKMDLQYWTYFSSYSLFCAITMGLVVYVVEQIRANTRLRHQVQQSDKMNVLSELAASFAHEIRNPMTVARGFMQILKQPDLAEEKRTLYTSMVMEEIDKAHSIVNDYLAFAKPHLEAIELVDAKLLIEQALLSIEPYAKLCHVEIETQLDDKLTISANKDKFVQCIMHLCKNGIEAMPSGGKLKIIGIIQNRTVCIDIIDHGVGMTPEEIRRLGTPFYSTREKGTGLGMMVTYRVIQTIHGKIDVTSEVGKGTCFSLVIPSLHTSSYH
ncbi:ATP-binding protein [Paenibacillus sp. UNC451MF]|uniref:ATP-binding protein n=1 Tax=Paenibacillus sp. UNC451MF TaxID=1449063 RepID=UPI00048FAFAB|nr:ATP-binding protein [Paenibacillus sp. UNC451MF]